MPHTVYLQTKRTIFTQQDDLISQCYITRRGSTSKYYKTLVNSHNKQGSASTNDIAN